MSVTSLRFPPDNEEVLRRLGFLAEFAGSWEGYGFNLIARPDYQGDANLYLQLNQTQETFEMTPIGSPVPNRACGTDNIDVNGLTYLHKVRDRNTGSALHIENGMWMGQPPVEYPPERPPAGGQIVYRLGTVPHGNTVLAQGAATTFSGTPPVLPADGASYAHSVFPAFNSTPITAVEPPQVPIMNAEGTSEAGISEQDGLTPFGQYDLSVPESADNPRTPYCTKPPEPPLPDQIEGVPMQEVVNDPVRILQAKIQQQVAEGYSFEGVAINVMTQEAVGFRDTKNHASGPYTTVRPPNAAGNLGNTPFLLGGEPTGNRGPNAAASLVYATTWIEKLTHPDPERPPIFQLQYAQMTVLNFQILHKPDQGIVGWPHISVATLRKGFF